MVGLTFGAAKAWNVQTSFAEFISKAEYLVYGHTGVYRFIETLNKVEDTVRWTDFMITYSNSIYGDYLEVELPDKESLLSAIEQCEDVRRELIGESWERDSYRQELLVAAEGLQVIAELLGNLQGFNIIRQTDTASWLRKYRSQWLKKNKPSEIGEIVEMFTFLETMVVNK